MATGPTAFLLQFELGTLSGYPPVPLEPDDVLPVDAGFGLPNIVLSDVFLLGAKTELKSCPIPRVVLHPATHAAITANARSRENMISLQGFRAKCSHPCNRNGCARICAKLM